METICPHCSYKETENKYDRDSGNFWKLTNNICLERDTDFFEVQSAYIYGCPSCKKLFVKDF